jgi:hypothetical protein
MSKSKFQPSKNFSPTTFGNEPVFAKFSEICNECDEKSQYRKYVNKFHWLNKLLKSIKDMEHSVIIGRVILKNSLYPNSEGIVASHYNNIATATFNKIILNKTYKKHDNRRNTTCPDCDSEK